MTRLWHIIKHGKVDKDFYTRNLHHLHTRNIKMLKIGFTAAVIINLGLFIFAMVSPIIAELRLFYGFFTVWFLLWAILVFTFLEKHHKYAVFFFSILSGTILIITAIASSYYAQNINAVTFFIFLIIIPGLYVNKPTCCITTTISSGIIFIIMVTIIKSDPYIIQTDIVNTIFSMIIGLLYNIYIVNMQLENLQASIILKEQTSTDELTSLPNRRCFNRIIETYFDTCVENDLTIIMMDIDFFKFYNDTYGHLKGDECLSAIGECLLETARTFDIFVARYGGEEFIAIDNKNGADKAQEIADTFVANIRALNIVNIHSNFGHVTLSAGYVSYSKRHAQNYMELINCADSALYQAKAFGRNQSQCYKK